MASKGNVMIVPGILGSYLDWIFGDPVTGQRFRVWPKYAILAQGFQVLQLAANGTSPLQGNSPIYASAQDEKVYGPLTAGLSDLGYNMLGLYWDWRTSITYDAQRLLTALQLYPQYWPVHLIGHSRGGLVIRAALNQLTQAQRAQMVASVVSLGTPHWGSWEALGMVAGWSGLIPLIRVYLTGPRCSIGFPPLRGQCDIVTVFASWPATYQLFPAPNAPGLDPEVVGAAYILSNWAGASVQPNPTWLAGAQQYWPLLGGVPADVSWLSIAGTGGLTRWQPLGSILSRSAWQYIYQGDNTVPALWARYGNEPFLTTPSAHSQLPQDSRLYTWIDQWFSGLGIGAPTVALTGPFLGSDTPF